MYVVLYFIEKGIIAKENYVNFKNHKKSTIDRTKVIAFCPIIVMHFICIQTKIVLKYDYWLCLIMIYKTRILRYDLDVLWNIFKCANKSFSCEFYVEWIFSLFYSYKIAYDCFNVNICKQRILLNWIHT